MVAGGATKEKGGGRRRIYLGLSLKNAERLVQLVAERLKFALVARKVPHHSLASQRPDTDGGSVRSAKQRARRPIATAGRDARLKRLNVMKSNSDGTKRIAHHDAVGAHPEPRFRESAGEQQADCSDGQEEGTESHIAANAAVPTAVPRLGKDFSGRDHDHGHRPD
jgi:hypothetical protein